MMKELSGHPLFCYDDLDHEVFGLVGISYDSKMTQIHTLNQFIRHTKG
jgi:hypothetical protein